MTNQLHPLQTTTHIRDTYLRYLKTIYPFQEPDLRDELWRALEEPDLLVKGPLLEASPPFQTGASIEELIQGNVLHPGFRSLCSETLPLTRPLYLHQEQGIRSIVSEGRNTVVASGTGSGKTETFLVPVLDHLLREETASTLDQPGVRALFLYPMNALANDQLKRLRRVLGHYPSITFGRYTGETREGQGEAESAFRDQFPHEPLLKNELISRERMRAAPPHILLTNYAMLEYLLLRPRDCEFFDGETGSHWRFLVIDEAHVYDGASGIEIAMLIRRLKDRVVRSERGRLCCIATSATLGRGEDDFPAVARFASELFAERFEWESADPARQDVVAATRLPMASLGERWGQGSPELYSALLKTLPTHGGPADQTIEALARAATRCGVPDPVVAEARRSALETDDAERVNRFLYMILQGDGRLRGLQDKLAEEPRFLGSLAEDLFPSRLDAAEQLIGLVSLAVRARPNGDSLSLLPTRYHVFARALEGAFACLNSAAHQGEERPPRLFLTRREECPHCGSYVVELATCTRCGTAYIVGWLAGRTDGTGPSQLHHLTGQPDDLRGQRAFFLHTGQVVEPDEDEAVATELDLEELADPHCEPYTLCLGCGAAIPGEETSAGCACAPDTARAVVQRVHVEGGGELRHCVSCGARSNAGIIFRFLTGRDAPVSVLATSLYQSLPPSEDPDMEDLPGEGRKLLAFADSRQDAAFFAPYFERTYRQVLRRRFILKTLCEDPEGREGRLRLQDLVGRLVRQAEDAGLFTQKQSYDERQTMMATWLMQEFIAWDRRISLEGLGLLRFRLVHPARWTAPPPLLQPPWNLSPDEAWELLTMLLDTLRHQGVVTFPPNVDPREDAFAPRNRELFVRHGQADAKKGIFGWVPTRGSNRRLDILTRLLACLTDMPAEERRTVALGTLEGIWNHLVDSGSVWREHLPSENRSRIGVIHRISHHFWEVVPLADAAATSYRCNRCRNVSYSNIRGLCPSYRCEGTLEPIDAADLDWIENHYRYLYRQLIPIPLSAEEHTAQWTSSEAAKVQERFVRGELNALSCSTTFELGVDVGELQAVLMRNVPPTTANYVQRAGRAGRRTDSAAYALTYAQRRSHDLTHYAHPERMVSGRIHPPVVVVRNEKIIRRHAHSVLFAAFLRWALEEHGRCFSNVGAFFSQEEPGPTGTDLLCDYAQARPTHLQEALQRIIPDSTQDVLDIEGWGWLSALWADDGDGILDRAVQEVTSDLSMLRQLEEEAVAERDYTRSQHFQRVISTVRGRDLLGFLGSRNVLPKYGFPTDVVEMRTNHLPVPIASKIELQRDLRIAISEYAPGGEVVAGGHVWVSGGLNTRLDRGWPTFNYAVCPECGRFHRSLGDIEGPCTVCGGNLFGWPRLYGPLLIPEFGFIVAEKPRQSGETRPQRTYSTRVYFAEYATPAQDGLAPEPTLERTTMSSARCQVWQRYSRFGKLALVNPGNMGRGFQVCEWCGFAQTAPDQPTGRRRGRPPAHANPRTGKACNGSLRTYHLGHEFITDVLELRFEGVAAAQVAYETWISTLYALLEGASEALGIRRDDLDGTLYRYHAGLAPALVLFDNVPGGAGHVERVADQIEDVLVAAWTRVNSCECGPETSCYECLRNFQNQPYHEQLERGLARDFLGELLSAAGAKI